MSKKEIDGVIKDYGERLFYPAVKGRKGRNLRGGKCLDTLADTKPSGSSIRDRIARMIRKSPEVVVKISGGGKNMTRIEEHMKYITRHGEELEDENGDIHQGRETLRDVSDSWAKGKIGIPREGEKRREAFNIILSMPPGTDRDSVKKAAREFAKENFSNHQYVFAAHENEKHPHVHLVVKAVDHNGIRLNPRKGDLQHWREQFAEKMREQGIEANATPRRARGIVKKAEKQAVWHIDKDFQQGKRKEPARVTEAQTQEAIEEIQTSRPRSNPAKEKILKGRKEAIKTYGEIARALASGDEEDKKIAVGIVDLVRSMPSAKTKHEDLVQSLKKTKGDGLEKEIDSVEKRGAGNKANTEEKGRGENEEEKIK